VRKKNDTRKKALENKRTSDPEKGRPVSFSQAVHDTQRRRAPSVGKSKDINKNNWKGGQKKA